MTAREFDAVEVVVTHDHSPQLSYHEWILIGRERMDRLGRSNPRMTQDNATLWQCNNGDCMAQALVRDEAVARLIDEATR